jgi:F0F1-type ATP synthase delta subunit
MQGASRESLRNALRRFDEQVGSLPDGAGSGEVSEGLFSVADLLDREPSLRRALTDPASDAAARRGLVERLLGGQVSALPLQQLSELVADRWSRPEDLRDVVEQLGAVAALRAAEGSGQLDDVEDELFRFARLLEREPDLRRALTDPALPSGRKIAVLDSLLGAGTASDTTRRLVTNVVVHPRGRSLEVALEELSALAAQRRERYVAGSPRPHRSRPTSSTACRPSSGGSTAARCSCRPTSTRPCSAACRCAWATRCSTAPSPASSPPPGATSPADPPAAHRPTPDLTARPDREQEAQMTELSIRPEDVRSAIAEYVSSYEAETTREDVGVVTEVGDGIARVEGLYSTMANELLEFEGGVLGLALNLDTREVGVVILGDPAGIEEGQAVRRTGDILSVPVGDGFLGRVVDPLGKPIDGKGEIVAEGRRILELQAPTVVQRQPVGEPLQTGIKAVDAMTAIGRGQRQLIIGDRQTGKTAVALDAIINQRENWATGDPKKQVKCIYVAIGQKGSTVAETVGRLEEAGAMEYTTVVAAPPASRPASSTSRPTPARASASTGCTTASTC